jgi:hypothetical protein
MSNSCDGLNKNKQECEKLIFDSFQDLSDKFKNYNDNYLCFVKPGTDSSIACDGRNIIPFGDTQKTTKFENLRTTLTASIAALDMMITNYKTNFMNATASTPTEGTDAFYTQLMEKYNKLLTTRKNLDEKLHELYENENNSLYSNKPEVDSAVITGILWTVLATTMIYYIFVKL